MNCFTSHIVLFCFCLVFFAEKQNRSYKVQVTSSNLQVSSSNSQVTCSNPQVKKTNVRVMVKLKFFFYGFKSMSYEFKFTSYEETKDMNCKINTRLAQVGILKAWVRRLKTQVKRKNSEFKYWTFWLTKKLIFFHFMLILLLSDWCT